MAQPITWNVSRQMIASGARSATTSRIHDAPSAVTNARWPARSPRVSKNAPTVSLERPSAAQTTWPVTWSQTTVKYFWPFLYLTSSIAIAVSPSSRSTRPSASSARRMHMWFTARHDTA